MRLILPKVDGPPTEEWARQLTAALERFMGEAQLSFLELSDTPYDYTGQADKAVLVASDESGLFLEVLAQSRLLMGELELLN